MSGYIGYRVGGGTKFVKVGEPTAITSEEPVEKAPIASLEPFSGSVTGRIDESIAETLSGIRDAQMLVWSEAVYAANQMRRFAFAAIYAMHPEFDVPSAEYGVPSVRERVSRLFGRSVDAQDGNMAQDAVRA